MNSITTPIDGTEQSVRQIVSIVSPGVTIEEEHIAREILNRQNATFGKEKGKVFLPLPSDSTAELDINVLPIDNYIDAIKVKVIIATKPVILLFNEYHDEENTIPAELKSILALNCEMATYNGRKNFQKTLERVI